MPSRSRAEDLLKAMGFDSLPSMLKEQPLSSEARSAAELAIEQQFSKRQAKIIGEAPAGIPRNYQQQIKDPIQGPKLRKLEESKNKLMDMLHSPDLEKDIMNMSEPFKQGSVKDVQHEHQSPSDTWVNEQYNAWKASWDKYFLQSPYSVSDGYVIQTRAEDNAPLYIFRLLLVAMSANPKDFNPVAAENAVQMKDLKFESKKDFDDFIKAAEDQFKGDIDPIYSSGPTPRCIGFSVKNDSARQKFLDWADKRGNIPGPGDGLDPSQSSLSANPVPRPSGSSS